MSKDKNVNSKKFFNPQVKKESYQRTCRADKKLSCKERLKEDKTIAKI